MGLVYVSDQISKKQTLGVQFAYVDIYSSGTQQSRVQAPALLLFDTVRFTQHSILTVYAGPEYARSSAVVPIIPPLYASVSQHDWHPSAGVTYAWAGTQNALTLEFSRRISSGGGLMNANIMTFGSAAFRSRITKRWMAEARLSVDNQDQLSLFNQERPLPDDLGRRRPCARDQPALFGPPGRRLHKPNGNGLGFVPGDHGLVQITFDVHFRERIGQVGHVRPGKYAPRTYAFMTTGNILLRRRWWLIGSLFGCWLLAWGASRLLPSLYRSETLILVEQQKVPEQYVVANVSVDLQEQLQSMTQQILSRTQAGAHHREVSPVYQDQRERSRPGRARRSDAQGHPNPAGGGAGKTRASLRLFASSIRLPRQPWRSK